MKRFFKGAIGICIVTVFVCMILQICALAETDYRPFLFLAPQSMNESDEILVPVYAQNIPKDNDGLCGVEFSFIYNTENFLLKKDNNGRPVLGTSEVMLVGDTDFIDVSEENGLVSVSYVDFSGAYNTVLRDGPLFYFVLVPKNPNALWNSDDYYSLRFVPGSVNLITLDKRGLVFSGTPAEGIDTFVGGYNAHPDFEAPIIEDEIKFNIGTPAVWRNGKEIKTDAAPYEKDGKTMLPLRYISEAIDMELYWDGESGAVTLYWPYRSAYFTIKDKKVYINAMPRDDLPMAEIVNDRSYVDISVIEEFFGDGLEIQRNWNELTFNFKEKR